MLTNGFRFFFLRGFEWLGSGENPVVSSCSLRRFGAWLGNRRPLGLGSLESGGLVGGWGVVYLGGFFEDSIGFLICFHSKICLKSFTFGLFTWSEITFLQCGLTWSLLPRWQAFSAVFCFVFRSKGPSSSSLSWLF